MASSFTLFNEDSFKKTEPIQQDSGGFFSRFKKTEPIQQSSQVNSSSFTLFNKDSFSNTKPVQEPDKTGFQKAVGVVSEVGKFGGQTLFSGLETGLKGVEGIINLTRNIPSRSISDNTLLKNIVTPPSIQKGVETVLPFLNKDFETPQKKAIDYLSKYRPQWVNDTIKNYQEAFDVAKGGGIEGLETGKIKPFTDLLPTAIGQAFGGAARGAEIIQEGAGMQFERMQPEFMKDPAFIQDYSNLTTGGKIKKYPLETLRMIAPQVIGSSGAVLGSSLLTGGTGAGSFILSAATAEDVRESAIKNGVDPQKAETLGIITAIPTMFLEKLGFDTILGRGALKDIGKTVIGRVLKSSLTEAATETSQEAIQIGVEKTFREVTGDEIKSRLAMSGLSGALGGLIFGTTAEAINHVTGKTDIQNAERRLEDVVDDSTKAKMIREGFDYKPTENAVLKQSFVDQMVQDVKQQSDLIENPKKKLEFEAQVSKLSNKDYSTIGEFQVELAKILPKKLDINVEKTAIGQEFNKAIAAADTDTQQYIKEVAFEQKLDNVRVPLEFDFISGGAAAPLQNILGDTLARLREERDKIKKEVGENPKEGVKQAIEGADQTIENLQKQYNVQEGQKIIQEVKMGSSSNKLKTSENAIPDELKPLLEEARKYKSADEFVNAQRTRARVEVRDKIGIKLQDPYTSEYLPTNSDGTITLYHSTTKENAEKIKQYGLIGSKTEGGDIYFTTNKKGYSGIGKGKDVVLAFNVDPKKVKFDDVYRGELHLKGNNADIGGIKPVEPQIPLKTQPSALEDIYNQANTQPIQRTRTTPTEPIQGTGKQRISRTAKKLEAKAVHKELINSFDKLPAFNSVNMEEQARLSSDLVNNDLERAKRIALGEEDVPDNMLIGSIYKAVESHALENNDIDTIQKLATQSTIPLEASALGQQLQAFREIDQTSPIAVISSIEKAREKNAKETNPNLDKEKKQIVKEIKEEIRKSQPKPKDWDEFINSLEC